MRRRNWRETRDEGREEEEEHETWSQATEAVEEDEPNDPEVGRKPVTMKAPQKVSKEARERHNFSHFPYEPWCPDCVKGRGHKQQHRRKVVERGKDEVPRVSMGCSPQKWRSYACMRAPRPRPLLATFSGCTPMRMHGVLVPARAPVHTRNS